MLMEQRECVHCHHVICRRRRRFCANCGLPFKPEHRGFRHTWRDVGRRLTRLTCDELAPGDVVRPGTWGLAVGPSDDPESAWPLEQLFEGIRVAELPDRLYLVRKDRGARAFRADMRWVRYPGL